MSNINNNRAIDNDSSFFSFKIEKSRNNKDILIINDKYIHSKFDPEAEAKNFIYKGKNLIIIFGVGLGYGINNIISNNPDSIFIIYEPIKEIFLLYKEKYYDQSIFKDKKLLLVSIINDEEIYNFIEKNDFFSEGRIYYYSNIGYKNILPKEEANFFNLIKKSFSIITQNILTESTFIGLWTKNFIYNSSQFSKSPIIDIKKNDMGNNLCVIACAGPNLTNDIPFIRNNRDKITLFAVDTALKPLLKNNIKPDFVVSLDGQFYSLDDFVLDKKSEISYIFDIICYPKLGRLVDNIYFTFTNNIFNKSIIEYFFDSFGIPKNGIDTGGTVADYALNLAISFGFKKIYLAGLDLSFPDFITHCKDSPYYEKTMFLSNYFSPPESMMAKAISCRSIKTGKSKISDKNVLTDFVLENYASYFSHFAKNNPDIHIYNSIYHSLKIENLKEEKLENIIDDSNRINSKDLLSQNHLKLIEKGQINTFFNEMINNLFEFSQRLKILFEKTDFNQNDDESLNNWKNLICEMEQKFYFLKKFSIMTEIILQKKDINDSHLIYYKHFGFKTMQSIYFLIRTIQKMIGV